MPANLPDTNENRSAALDSGMLSDPKAADLFSFVSGKFAGIKTYGDLSAATFDSAEKILQESGKGSAEDADAFLVRAFSGEAEAKEFWFDGTIRSVNFAVKNAER